MLDMNLLFKVAAVGIITMIIDKVLKANGKEDIAMAADFVGLIIVLTMVVTLVAKLFDTVKAMFTF